MSKFDNLNIGDVIIVTGIDENLLECDSDSYDTLLGVMQQPCEVLDINDDIQLWSNCRMRSQKGVLIKSPKLQGHDGGGRCPEFNCYWIGRDYVNFEPLSYDKTTDIFDKLNESEENFKQIMFNDLEIGMNVFVNGDDGMGRSWDNEVGKVVYNWNEDEDNTSNSVTIAFNNNYNGHDNDSNAHECVNNNCWNFYDDCAYSNHKYCQNIEKISFYTIDSYSLFNNLNESKDDFDWVKDIVNSDLKFGSVKGDLKIGDVITVTGGIVDTDGTPLVDLDEEPFLVVKNNKFELTNGVNFEYSYRIELNWFNPNSKRPSNWQRASMHSDDGKDIISFTDECSEWDDGLIVKFLKK